MSENNYAKIQITGTIEVMTGMHIGGNSAFSAIGAVDSPVIKDIRTNLPIIPGSSLKGKLRTLLAKAYNCKTAKTPDDDNECLLSLFGSAKKDAVKRGRVIISDMFMSNEKELRERGLQSMTEIKFENTINRLTAVANPRQMERVFRGTEFELDIIYEADETKGTDNIVDDFEILADGFMLLQYDYLGGSGTRGYGKVKFKDLSADAVVGDVSEEIIEKCNRILAEVSSGR